MKLTTIIIIIIIVSRTIGSVMNNRLAGFDCGERLSNLTTISLLEVGECDIEEPEISVTNQQIQLLQINEFTKTHVIQCSIKITRIITHCGMHSHATRVKNGEVSYFLEVQRDECTRMQTGGYINIVGTSIQNLKKNSTFSTPITFAGNINHEGHCKGTSYADPYGQWDDVVVQGHIEVSLTDYYAAVNLNANKIQLRSGTSCKLTDTNCRDVLEGYAYWEPLPDDTCGSRKYTILYDGHANKTKEIKTSRITYILETQDIMFALTSVGEIKVCGHNLIRTEHPKLFILESPNDNTFIPKSSSPIENLDIFTYVNSKFVYVERHFKKQINQMYYDLLKHKCELEKEILINALSIAVQAPDEFAFRLMKEPGYMAVTAGEVVHLIKCLQVEVQRRDTKECYNQLPVFQGAEPLFLSPRTRILTKAGTQISCSSAMPPMFQIGTDWIQFLPAPSNVMPPETLHPQTKGTWEYTAPKALAISGIYTETDLNNLRDHIMFPLEKSSVLNNVAMGMTGKSIQGKGISINQFLDPETLERLANNTWDRIWGKFLTFGTASAAIIGIIMIARIIKLLIDTILHGYAIYSVYGFSIHLLGSIWNSVTQLLLHLGNRKDAKDSKQQTKKEKQTSQGEERIYDDVEGRSEHVNFEPSQHRTV